MLTFQFAGIISAVDFYFIISLYNYTLEKFALSISSYSCTFRPFHFPTIIASLGACALLQHEPDVTLFHISFPLIHISMFQKLTHWPCIHMSKSKIDRFCLKRPINRLAYFSTGSYYRSSLIFRALCDVKCVHAQIKLRSPGPHTKCLAHCIATFVAWHHAAACRCYKLFHYVRLLALATVQLSPSDCEFCSNQSMLGGNLASRDYNEKLCTTHAHRPRYVTPTGYPCLHVARQQCLESSETD